MRSTNSFFQLSNRPFGHAPWESSCTNFTLVLMCSLQLYPPPGSGVRSGSRSASNRPNPLRENPKYVRRGGGCGGAFSELVGGAAEDGVPGVVPLLGVVYGLGASSSPAFCRATVGCTFRLIMEGLTAPTA